MIICKTVCGWQEPQRAICLQPVARRSGLPRSDVACLWSSTHSVAADDALPTFTKRRPMTRCFADPQARYCFVVLQLVRWIAACSIGSRSGLASSRTMTWKTRTPAVRILASFWGMLGGMSTATVQRIRRRHDSRSAAGRAADERAATLHLLHGPRGDCFELCIFRVAGVCGVCRHDAAPPARWGFKTRWVLRAPSTDRPYEALAWARAHYSRLALREARRKMRQP